MPADKSAKVELEGVVALAKSLDDSVKTLSKSVSPESLGPGYAKVDGRWIADARSSLEAVRALKQQGEQARQSLSDRLARRSFLKRTLNIEPPAIYGAALKRLETSLQAADQAVRQFETVIASVSQHVPKQAWKSATPTQAPPRVAQEGVDPLDPLRGNVPTTIYSTTGGNGDRDSYVSDSNPLRDPPVEPYVLQSDVQPYVVQPDPQPYVVQSGPQPYLVASERQPGEQDDDDPDDTGSSDGTIALPTGAPAVMVKKLGNGSFGDVFLYEESPPQGEGPVEDGTAPHRYAVKTLKGDANQKKRDEMKLEADMLERSGATSGDQASPYIVRSQGLVEIGGRPALVLEYIEGADGAKSQEKLSQAYRSGKISHEKYWAGVRHMTESLLMALKHLEDCGISHTDIRLDNMLVDKYTGAVKLADFGLATRKGDQPRAFLPGAAAPELAKGSVASVESDMFMIGSATYQSGLGKDFLFGLPRPNDIQGFPQQVGSEGLAYIQENRTAIPVDRSAPDRPPGGGPEGGVVPRDYDRLLREAQDALARIRSADQGLIQVEQFGRTEHQTTEHKLDELEKLVDKAADTYDESVDLLHEGPDRARLADAKAAQARSLLLEVLERADALLNPRAQKLETAYVAFVNALMNPDPKARLSVSQALAHPFIATPGPDGAEVLRDLLGGGPLRDSDPDTQVSSGYIGVGDTAREPGETIYTEQSSPDQPPKYL
jgi:serine/threonine protein kinase